MRAQNLLTILKTTIILSLPIAIGWFNSSVIHNKSKVYTEIVVPETAIHPTIHAFGQSRLQHSKQKNIVSEQDLEQLYQIDWSDYQLKTVVIDPGHGGRDEGAIGQGGVQEKDVVLSIAQKLGAYIKGSYPEVKVIFTRTSDTFIPLKTRASIANDNNADLFISIHCNSFRLPSVRGTETYVMGLHRAEENMEVLKRENDVVLLEEDYETSYEEYGVEKNSPLYDILINSYQNAFLEQSLSFAEIVEGNLKSEGHKSRGVRQAGFLVLRRTAMPSVLVETGYLTNSTDKAILSSESGQSTIARNLYFAFMEYKASVEAVAKKKREEEEKALFVAEKVEIPQGEVVEEKIEEKPKSDIQFVIQLASSDKELNLAENKWRLYKDRVVMEKSDDGVFRYMLKDFGADYSTAKSEKKKLREHGFTGCFVIAYKKDKRIELYKAKKELGLD